LQDGRHRSEDAVTISLKCRAWVVLVLFCLVVSAPGCGTNELESSTAVKLRGLGNFYLDYAVAKNGKGPADEQDLRKHMRHIEGSVLRMNGVDPNNLDPLFVSDRDQEPFVVLYGLTLRDISGAGGPLVAHEKNGKKGKRLVVFGNAKVEEVDEARFQELKSPKPE
jgi:hypothetical protein